MVSNRLVCASLHLLLLLFAASPGRGLTPSLVKDIDPDLLSLGSAPFPFLSLANGLSLFLADGVETGRELWRSDGTAEGTWRLLDACAGPCSVQYRFFAPAGDRAFFVTSELGIGDLFGSLWVTSGAPAGTVLLAEKLRIHESVPPVWVPDLALFFFVASDGEHGFELWRSDGTAAGTWMVRDLDPGIESSQTLELTAFQGRLYFAANHRENGPALWMSNGTPGGTRMIRDPWVGRSDHHAPAFLRSVGSVLYFFAPSPSFGFDLWRSDGSRAGTVPVTDLVPGRDDLRVAGAAVAGGRFYFVADAGEGEELWTSNGNVRSTRRLTDAPDPFAFSTGQLHLPVPAPGGRAAFLAGEGMYGLEPWLTNGTPAGTRRLDLCPGPCSSRPVFDQVHAGRLYFVADDGTRGLEPWVSDGTVAGTRLLRNLCPGSCSSNPDFLQPVGSQLLLTANRVSGGTLLLRTDGTATGTIGIAAFPVPLVPLEQAGAVPGALLFSGWDPEHGVELWRTDATAAGTLLLEDLQGIVPADSSPVLLTSVDDRLRFVARTRDGDALHIGFWESDGSAAGTVPRGGDIPQMCLNEIYLLATLPDGDPLFACDESYVQRVLWRGTESGPVRLTTPEVSVYPFGRAAAVLGSTVLFSAAEPGHGFELWKTDGTPEGTVRVKELLSGYGDATPYDFTVFQGRVFFSAWSDQTYSRGLWSSDGTEEGTQLLQLPEGVDFLNLLGPHGGRLWFAARLRLGRVNHGFELWSTDGTTEGIRELNLVPGLADLAPFRLISAGSRMFFAGTNGGRGLWVSDGTQEGSRRIGGRSLLPHPDSDAALVGERLFYRSFEDDVLWQSDGTAAGTGPVPGPDGEPIAGARDLTAFAGQLFFLWRDAIWRTDGTAAGTLPVEGDFQAPGELTVAGPRLFFRATDALYGSELWALEP